MCDKPPYRSYLTPNYCLLTGRPSCPVPFPPPPSDPVSQKSKKNAIFVVENYMKIQLNYSLKNVKKNFSLNDLNGLRKGPKFSQGIWSVLSTIDSRKFVTYTITRLAGNQVGTPHRRAGIPAGSTVLPVGPSGQSSFGLWPGLKGEAALPCN